MSNKDNFTEVSKDGTKDDVVFLTNSDREERLYLLFSEKLVALTNSSSAVHLPIRDTRKSFKQEENSPASPSVHVQIEGDVVFVRIFFLLHF